MSNMQIEVVANPVNTVPTAKGSYQVIELAYKNKSFQDKLEGKKVMSFTNKDVFSTLSNAKFGDVFNITRVKNDKNFWDWTAIRPASMGDQSATNVVSSGSPSPANVARAGTPSPSKSTYETAEERAARQVLIVRQSSLGHAVEYAVANKIKDEAEILAMATRFSDWVFQKEPVSASALINAIEEPPKNFFEDFPDDDNFNV